MISSSLHSKPCPVLLFLVLLKHTSFASLIWSPSVPSFLPSYSHSVCLNFFNWLGRDPYSRPSHSWNFQSLTHWTCPLEKLFTPLLPVLFLNQGPDSFAFLWIVCSLSSFLNSLSWFKLRFSQGLMHSLLCCGVSTELSVLCCQWTRCFLETTRF